MSIRNEFGVRNERTGFRDDKFNAYIQENWGDGIISQDIPSASVAKSISARHRKWGDDCPATNIDMTLIEYDRCIPVAIVDIKMRRNLDADSLKRELTSANGKTQANLATKADLPFYIVGYTPDWKNYVILPGNKIASIKMSQHFGSETSNIISEHDYVSFLYALRNRKLPASVAAILSR